jgi:flagellar hook-length control protein FliK
MSALLLSSAPVSPASVTGISSQPTAANASAGVSSVSSGSSTPQVQAAGRGSFGESLSASQAALSQSTAAGKTLEKPDLSKLSTTLEKLASQLEALDPGLFQSLRDFINGQDLSTQGLQTLQAGGELPDFFAALQQSLESEQAWNNPAQAGLDALSDLELSALESSFFELNAIVNRQAEASFNADSLPGLAFTLVRDAKAGEGFLNEGTAVQLRWQKYDPQMLSQQNQTNVQNLQPAQSSQAVTSAMAELPLQAAHQSLQTDTEKAFNAHFEAMKGELPSGLSELAESLADVGIEPKDKGGAAKFTELQLRTASDVQKPYSTTLMTPVDAKEWADEVSQKIVWFTGRNIQAAEMHLNPADLGPIDVKINVQNDVASVSFNVQNASVRELLESNVVRLREMMESNGVNLGDVNVDSGAGDAYREAQNQAAQSGNHGKGLNGSGDELSGSTDEDGLEQAISVKTANLVDYFV